MIAKTKSLALLVTPPIVQVLYRKLRPQKTWAGMYPHLRAVPHSGEGFQGSWWIDRLRHVVDSVESNTSSPIPQGVTGDRVLLPILASSLCQATGACRILDFGGGLGDRYLHVKRTLSDCDTLDYTVVETAPVAAEGSRLFREDTRIRFVTSVPHDVGVDIVYADATLQYVDDYTSLLGAFCALTPRYILFVRLTAGQIQTYATAQVNVPGQQIPYWFFNINELRNILERNSYRLVFAAAAEHLCAQDNFPPEARIGRASNLLFARTAPAVTPFAR